MDDDERGRLRGLALALWATAGLNAADPALIWPLAHRYSCRSRARRRGSRALAAQ